MRIGIDALSLRPGEIGGQETFVVNLLRHLAQVDTVNEYHVFVLPRVAKSLALEQDNMVVVECPIPGRGGKQVALRLFYEQFLLPGRIRRAGLDVMVFLGNFASAWCPCPYTVTIHDLAYTFYAEHFPGYYGLNKAVLMPILIKRSARRAARVMASSQFSKREITGKIGIPPEHVEVVYLGIEEGYGRTKMAVEGDVAALQIGAPYLLYAGRENVHKNLERLFRAFVLMKQETALPHKLVLAGSRGDASESLDKLLAELNCADIMRLGWLSEPTLRLLYKHAEVFVFPTLYEGFGLPILEAMACGIPVATSNAGPLPEVAGEAALFFDPLDIDNMVGVLRQILTDQNLREQLREKGQSRASGEGPFCWTKTAQAMLEVINHCAAERGRSG